MAEGKQSPIGRIQFWDKNAKKAYDCAAIFPNSHHDWKKDVSPTKRTDLDGRYPCMSLEEAARRASNGEGYLSLVESKPRAASQPKRDNFDDGDVPF